MHLKQQFSGLLVVQVVPVEHVQLFKGEYSCQKKWHTEHVSQIPSMHVNRPFSGCSVVRMPCDLPVLLRVARPLHSEWGGEGTVTWGTFPRGCEGTIARRCFLYKGGGGGRRRDRINLGPTMIRYQW